MLVVSRTCDEKVILRHATTGEVIVIDQREVARSVSRIGITAAPHWKIVRAELLPIDDPNHPEFGRDYA